MKGSRANTSIEKGTQKGKPATALAVSSPLTLQRKCACGGTPNLSRECADCEGKHGRGLRRDRIGGLATASAPSIMHEALATPGTPLEGVTRRFMEPRFGHDFSDVRIHTGSHAAASAHAVNALAYTVGRHMVFGAGQYAPETSAGRQIVSHELTHVVQQRGAGHADSGGDLQLDSPTSAAEQEAQRVGERVAHGQPMNVIRHAAPTVQRSVAGVLGGAAVGGILGAGIGAFAGPVGALIGGIGGAIVGGIVGSLLSPGKACAGPEKTVTVDTVKLRGTTGNPAADVTYANNVFSGCCVKIVHGVNATATDADSDAWIGADQELQSGNCGNPTSDELNAHSGATTNFKIGARIRAFYAATISSPARADSYTPSCATGAAAPLSGMVNVSNSAASRTLAHEVGHILLDADGHAAEADNLMHPTDGATGEQLTPTQCATIYGNA